MDNKTENRKQRVLLCLTKWRDDWPALGESSIDWDEWEFVSDYLYEMESHEDERIGRRFYAAICHMTDWFPNWDIVIDTVKRN